MDLILILLIVGCITLYPAYKTLLGPRKHVSIGHVKGGQQLYEDEDGSATQESELQYSMPSTYGPGSSGVGCRTVPCGNIVRATLEASDVNQLVDIWIMGE